MKLSNSALGVFCALVLWAGCRSSQDGDPAYPRRELRREMAKARAELKAGGATAAQLREFDRTMATLESTIGKLEKQVRGLEKQLNEK